MSSFGGHRFTYGVEPLSSAPICCRRMQIGEYGIWYSYQEDLWRIRGRSWCFVYLMQHAQTEHNSIGVWIVSAKSSAHIYRTSVDSAFGGGRATYEPSRRLLMTLLRVLLHVDGLVSSAGDSKQCAFAAFPRNCSAMNQQYQTGIQDRCHPSTFEAGCESLPLV